jgi:hypothetical protein
MALNMSLDGQEEKIALPDKLPAQRDRFVWDFRKKRNVRLV